MQILFITWNYPPKIGGMEIMLHSLVETLNINNVVYVIGPGSSDDSESAVDARVMRPKIIGLPYFFLFSFVVGVYCQFRYRCDIILVGGALLTPIAYIIGILFNIPVVPIVFGLDLIYPNPIYQLMVRTILPRCSKIVAISQASMNAARERGVSPHKIEVIYPGIDFSEFSRLLNHDLGVDLGLGDRPLLLSVGRLAKRKGVYEFISNSLPKIVKRYPDVLYLVVGDNPSYSLAHREDMKTIIWKKVQEQVLEKNVLMLGRVSRKQLLNLYYSCDIFVFTGIDVDGDMEGFGIVLIEANAAGKPVVATKVGGVTDAVENRFSGRLVSPGDWDEIANVVIDLLANEQERYALGNYGKARVESEFDWGIIAAKYESILSEVVKNHHQ
jgi:phosphatidylinositol alpha-1,6-mannosyltransferase